MDQLHARASALIARVTGAEAGFVTSCAAAGLTLAVAGCMTGTDPGKVAQLPDTTGLRDEVLIQVGHCVDYGAPVTQGIRLAGARVKTIGTVNGTAAGLLAASINERTAAAMYVVSHHTVQYGQIPLATFVATAHARGVPVIVDMAAEELMVQEVVASGADLVILSGHKHFRGPTSGVMAGRMELVRAAHAQNRGIGRGMKIGKEGILGLMAALEVWEQGGAQSQQAAEQARIRRMVARLNALPGLTAAEVWPAPDPYPIMRAKVTVDPAAAGLTATALTVLLAEGDPSVRTRSHHVDEGYFLIDPFNLTDGEGDYICERIAAVLALPAAQKAETVARLRGLSAADLWAATGPWPYFEVGE